MSKSTILMMYLVLFFSACSKPAEPAAAPETIYTYKLMQWQRMTVGREQEEETTIQFTSVVDIARRITPQQLFLKMTFKDAAIDLKTPHSSLKYDSRVPADGNRGSGAGLKEILGQTIGAEGPPTMEQLKLEGIEKLLVVPKALSPMLNESAVQETLRRTFMNGRFFAVNPFPGGTWSSAETIAINDKVAAQLDLRFRVEEASDTEARISMEGDAALLDPVTRQPVEGAFIEEKNIQGSVMWNNQKQAASLFDAVFLIVFEYKLGIEQVPVALDYRVIGELQNVQ